MRSLRAERREVVVLLVLLDIELSFDIVLPLVLVSLLVPLAELLGIVLLLPELGLVLDIVLLLLLELGLVLALLSVVVAALGLVLGLVVLPYVGVAPVVPALLVVP